MQYFELLVCGAVSHPSVMFSAGMRLVVRQSEFLSDPNPHRSQYPIEVEKKGSPTLKKSNLAAGTEAMHRWAHRVTWVSHRNLI